MKAGCFSFIILLVSLSAKAQSIEYVSPDPVYVLDSVVVTEAAISKLGPDAIAMITIAKGKKAVAIYGEQAENGVIYMETKPFARNRINRLLSAYSPEYSKLLKQYGNDSTFQYIVNDHLITPTDETQLVTLEKKSLLALEILDPRLLKERYQVTGKNAGVVIKALSE
jgi:hypothetical protein